MLISINPVHYTTHSRQAWAGIGEEVGGMSAAALTREDDDDESIPQRKGAGSTLQTLSRGLRALELISKESNGLLIAELASLLDIHRAIAYRLVTTLELEGLITRDRDGRLRLGAGLLVLSSRFEAQLRRIAAPVLQSLATRAQATAFISVPQGDECTPIMTVEPASGALSVAYRVGSRHSIKVGAAGIAILAGRPEHARDSEDVRRARSASVSITRGMLQPGAVGVASPIQKAGAPPLGIEASVGVVALDDLNIDQAASAVKEAAEAIASLIAGKETA